MGLDPLSPVAPSRVRCLLVPCGQITRSRFLEFAQQIQCANTVRLGDVNPKNAPDQNMFSPLAFPAGVVIYDITVSLSSPAQRALYPFELCREPFVVLGVGDGREYGLSVSETGNGSEAFHQPFREFEDVVSELGDTLDSLQATYTISLIHQIMLFDCDQDLPYESFISVPSATKTTPTTLKSIMCGITALLLAEMATYAKSIQALPSIDTPRQTMPEGYSRSPGEEEPDSRRQSWLPGSSQRSSSPANAFSRSSYRMSLPAHLFSRDAVSDSGSESGVSSPDEQSTPTTFDQMSPPKKPKSNARDSSNDRFSLQAFGSGSPAEKSRNQGRGRVKMVIGSMYLMAGRWPDAVKELSEAGATARAMNDHIWHAKALELVLVSLLMCAWAGVDFEIPQLCQPANDKILNVITKAAKNIGSSSPLPLDTSTFQPAGSLAIRESLNALTLVVPELVNRIISLCHRSTAEPVSQIALSETTLRLSKLLATASSRPGPLTQGTMQTIILNEPSGSEEESDPEATGIVLSRSEIALLAMTGMPPAALEVEMDFSDRMNVYAGTAAVLALLGYHRKKAFILRGILMLLIPALSRTPADELSNPQVPSKDLARVDFPGAVGSFTAGTNDSAELDNTVQSFLQMLCRVYGVLPTDTSSPQESNQTAANETPTDETPVEPDTIGLKIQSEVRSREFGSMRLKTSILRICINMCEIVPDIHGVIAFTSNLLKTAGSGIAPGLRDTDGNPSITVDEQKWLSETMSSATSAASRAGLKAIEPEYWDDFLVRDISILASAPDNAMVLRKRSDLDAAKSNLAKNTNGPFIVNAFGSKPAAASKETMLVAEEKATFTVLLQNLYDISLEIDWLELIIEGMEIKTMINNLLVGPYTTQRFKISAAPPMAGEITVSGCRIKVRNCKPRNYSVFYEAWRPHSDIKIKSVGLATLTQPGRPSSVATDPGKALAVEGPKTMSAKAKVVGPQPLLSFKSMSLSQENLIIHDGEKLRFNVTVENNGKRTIDMLTLRFDDTTQALLKSAIQEREIPAAEIYELEYGLYKKVALSWIRPAEDVVLAPGQSCDLQIEVLGKPHVNEAVVLIEYGSMDLISEDQTQLYTRSLSIPFNLTQMPSVELIRSEVMQMSGVLARADDGSIPDYHLEDDAIPRKSQYYVTLMKRLRKRLGMIDAEQDYCLLCLDLYNAMPFNVFLSPQLRLPDTDKYEKDGKEWTEVYNMAQVAGPGESIRFIIPFPRIHITNLLAPIPSLNPSSRRQFVVSNSKVSQDYEMFSRECFWYREAMLSQLRVHWQISDNGRTGAVELRSIRLSARMLEILKTEEFSISCDLAGSGNVVQIGASRFRATTDEFLSIRTKVTNRMPYPVHPLLRLQPALRNQPYNVALDISKKFAFSGLLQRPLPLLQPGKSNEVELGVMFLCAGEFEIGASVEEIRIWKAPGQEQDGNPRRAGSVELDVLASVVRTERKTWYSRQTCQVNVVDGDDM